MTQPDLPFDPPLPPSDEPLILVHFFKHFGRMGDIECLFVTTHKKLKKIMGQRISLGEALGKHSEVIVVMNDGNTKIVSEDQEKIIWLVNIGNVIPVGWNLVETAEEQMDEESDPDDQ